MSILFVLIPLSLALMGIALWALFWAADSGQFDDLDASGRAVLQDDDREPGGATQADAGRVTAPDG